jgi:hypothetical protein
VNKTYSENYEAACKAQCEAEIEVIEGYHERMAKDVQTRREKLGCPAGIGDDQKRFQRLFDQCKPHWEKEEDKAAMQQFFRQLAKGV